MIGDGALRLELQNKARDAGIGEYFVFTGLISHSEAPPHLAACDILVSPHLGFADGTKFFGSPTKLFEYMAMGKPIIASNLEQIGKIIVDGVNGLWMTPGNAAELAGKIAILAADRKLRKQLGEAARIDCAEKYTWEANVKKVVEELYRRSMIDGVTRLRTS
jgi:glycosyltransferase involved in cell wall biosynthesis